MPAEYLIPLSRPDIGSREKQAVLQVLDSGNLSLGPVLPEFEKAFATAMGSQYAIAVNSGTSGLHLCMKAANLNEGDEVITSPFSFVASANCILFERCVPRFVDIDPLTYNFDESRIAAAITSRTRAILPVHVFGRPCRMDLIEKLALKNGLTVIEDACEAVGAKYRGKCAGTFGQTGVFAFYPNKQMTTGEGGVIITADAAIAGLCRSWRNQGRGTNGAWLQHERLGYNYRLSDLNCAVGRAQLYRLNEILSMRAAVAAHYSTRIQDRIPALITPALPEKGTEISWFIYVVRLLDEFSRSDRDQILQFLRSAGIGCSDYFSPIHLNPFYREMFGYKPGDFPITESVAERTIALPFFNRLTEAQIETVVTTLATAIGTIKPSFRVKARKQRA